VDAGRVNGAGGEKHEGEVLVVSFMSFRLIIFAFLITTLAPVIMVAQQPAEPPQTKECEFPIASSRVVDRKAKILSKPDMKLTEKEIYRHSGQVVILRALLCGSGEVTNIRVVRGVSDTVDAKAIDASRLIRFNPAEQNSAKVSTAVMLEYRVNVFRVRR
jgi:TonB family protein